ncbi:non-oxidative hydroxyarylic acid decarboxylases subunit D [Neisseria perflava]|uniref:non-oxidative hydroxyarylic acid decarboxylases subunit D n=1 Tax=Neisseria perflava TaxID=33053 RepID=UPI00209D6F2E|nr:non-oxidative hydroxyarylic acid decarboxylases subunit D [Neisseria perflava]MCP1661169.1 transcription elongation factor Elf1 [Neisseria perflava]MCP1773462.1 transcription elongation factor Elf1 [Neisseria perflava]
MSKQCPRCNSHDVSLLTKSPVGDVWEVYICGTCTLSWRSTEGENITNPDKYDARFKLDPAHFDELAQIPPIPPLKG